MKYCSKCGKELFDGAVVCTQCGCAVGSAADVKGNLVATSETDRVSIGLCILAALFPLFGFVYWPVQLKKTPKKALACGITAIVSWAIDFAWKTIAFVVEVLLFNESITFWELLRWF